MKKNQVVIDEKNILEIISGDVVISNAGDMLDLLTESWIEGIILYEHNLNEEFFDLSTGIAGEILDKITTYRLRFAVIGDFAKFPSKALQDFIRETNRTGEILFVEDMEKVRSIWS